MECNSFFKKKKTNFENFREMNRIGKKIQGKVAKVHKDNATCMLFYVAPSFNSSAIFS